MSDWRDTYEYRVWRATVIMRDKRCVICNSLQNRHAHHVNHATYFPELRFDPDNGVTLCGDCHMNYHCQMNRSYRTLCDEYNFMNFVKLSTHFHGLWSTACWEDIEYRDPAGPVPVMPRSGALSTFYAHQCSAFDRSPDSVVGYVTELATLRYPDVA